MKLTIEISTDLAKRIKEGNSSPYDVDALLRRVRASLSLEPTQAEK